MTISPAATIVLIRAAERPDHRLEFHRKLPTGGRHKMIDALLRDGMIAETLGDYRLGEGSTLIENSATGLMLTALRITDAGLAAVAHEVGTATAAPNANTAPQAATDAAAARQCTGAATATDGATVAPTAGMPARITLRQAARAVLAAWDSETDREADMITALENPMAALRSMLAERAPGATARTPGTPRTGTKQEAVLALLRREEGANVAQIVAATAWAQHTVRGFLANLKRKGFAVEVAERVRLPGPSTAGAKGAYTVYRITTPVTG